MFTPEKVQPENPDAHPAISPADIAQLMAKKLAEGFTPNAPHRTRVMENDAGFVPADFRSNNPQPAEQPHTVAPPDQTVEPKQTDENTSGSVVAEGPIKTPSRPSRDIEAELKAAYDRGLSEGRKLGAEEVRAEEKSTAVAELAQARDLFLMSAKAFSEPSEATISRLSQAMLDAISRLTAERVGTAINDHPEAFLSRVQVLAERVSQGVRQVNIHLNTTDLDLIQTHLTEGEIEQIKLVDSKTLRRGEVEIRGDGITLQDLLPIAKEGDQ